MSNTSGTRADSDQTQRSETSPHANALVCTKCGATKIAESHPKILDELSRRFIPKRPYRCLHCHHRFWKWEGPFAYRRRAIVWAAILVILVLLLLARIMLIQPTEEVVPIYQASVSTDPYDTQVPVSGGATFSAPSSAKSVTRNRQYVDHTKPLTPEQLAQKMAQARAQAENAKTVNEARKDRLQKTMLGESAELESLLKVDIGYNIENWRKAWQAGRVEKYLAFYSDDFIPQNGLSREKWEDSRRQRVEPSKQVSLQLSGFEVQFVDKNTRSTVSFDQSYVAGSYRDLSRKQLVLLKQQQEWKIVSETEINK